jgi:hypothetical protein
MTRNERSPGLDIDTDLAFQRRWWMAERVAWVLLSLLLIAGLAGAFGGGPLSRARTSDFEGGVFIEYERFARLRAPTELRVSVVKLFGQDGALRVRLRSDYARSVEIHDVVPAPQAVVVEDSETVYTFAAESLRQPVEVIFRLNPQQWGRLPCSVAVDGKPPASFVQFVYP